MKKWASYTGYTALLNENGTKLRDLPPKSLMKATGDTKIANGILLEHVIFTDTEDHEGWVEARKVETYNENFERDCVYVKDIQTHDLRDAEQYIIWKKESSLTQVNMCGELSICYLLKIKLSEMLEKWEQDEPSFWRKVFGSGKARGTYAEELVKIFDLFGKQAETLAKYKSYTPDLLNNLIGAIVGVKISPRTGRLAGSGAGHWVVVTEVLNERAGYGLVYIYNPFPNRIEVYSYAEFLASAQKPYGAMMQNH